MAPQIGDDDGSACQPVAGSKEVHHGFVRQMMSQLAYQDHIHALVPDRRCSGAPHGNCKTGILGQSGSHPIELEAKRYDSDPASRTPALSRVREIAQPGAEVEQRERGTASNLPQGTAKAKTDSRRTAEPPVGPSDVVERLGNGSGISRRIIQQLSTDAGDGKRAHAQLRAA
jgi:hypothetical protein